MAPLRAAVPALLVLLAAAPAAAQGTAVPAMCEQTDYALDAPAPVSDDRLTITADEGLFEQNGLSNLAGAVKLRQGSTEFSAAALKYDDAGKRVSISVESLFRNEDFIIRSGEASFDLSSEEGIFTDTEFTLTGRGARGQAEEIVLGSDGSARIREVSYTTCPPDSQAWQLRGSRISLDHEEGLGTAVGASLRFGGVPILYLPWFQFPIDDRRRTGFLFPTIGESSQTGLDLRIPLYINLAPHYDMTLTPRYMGRRGLQLGTGARYLFSQGEGSARFEYLPRDEVTQQQRNYFETQNVGRVNQRLGYSVQAASASDRTYFEDLGDQGTAIGITHLERSGRLIYQAPAAYTVKALLQDYQTLSTNLLPADEPYARLPQVTVSARTKNSRLHSRLGLSGEYVNFARKDSVEGQRFNLVPYLRTERAGASWFAAAQADYRYTAYDLTGVAPGQPASPSRSLPQFSSEGGLRFERITAGGKLQTLEPYVSYLYTPFRDQTLLPLFDTGEPDFDYTQLFARNRFSGEDRISDANQMAVAATSRLLNGEGEVKFSASVGQLFRFQPSRVAVPGTSTPDQGATDFFAGLDYNLSARWRYSLDLAWSPDERVFNRSSTALHYRDAGRRFDLAYRYRRDLLEQADVTASLPLFGGWRGAVRSRYSIDDDAPLDTLAGLEYETCCYALRASYRRYIANTAGEYNRGLYLQIELKGLTRIGSDFDGLLPVDDSLAAVESRN